MEISFDRESILKDPDGVLDFLESFYMEHLLVKKENEKIKQENEDLRSRLQKLEAEIAKFISPHIPSSKQLYPKNKLKQSGLPKKPTGKKGGSKKGKSGATWNNKEPDEVIHNYVENCLKCHKQAPEEEQRIINTKRVLEIPKQIPISILEYHIHQYECGDCGETTQAEDPTIEGTSLGPNFLAFIGNARSRTGASFENISKLVEDVSEVKISQTALNRGLSVLCDVLEPVADEIATEVMNSDIINIDETSHKLVEEGKRSQQGSKKVWVWVFGTNDAAYYHVDMTRSIEALETALEFREQGKPPPISVSDAYPAYINTFEIKQFCWAHLLRDSKEIEDACFLGKLLHDQLVDIFQKIKAIKEKLQEKDHAASQIVYDKALMEINEIAEAGSCKKTKTIQNHLKRRMEQYLTCLKYPKVPMTNNHAERLLKTVIVHRSNGKPFRSRRAMKQYGTLLTVLTTWKLRGLPVGTTLREQIGKHINKVRLV